jgi:hypothetical protein
MARISAQSIVSREAPWRSSQSRRSKSSMTSRSSSSIRPRAIATEQIDDVVDAAHRVAGARLVGEAAAQEVQDVVERPDHDVEHPQHQRVAERRFEQHVDEVGGGAEHPPDVAAERRQHGVEGVVDIGDVVASLGGGPDGDVQPRIGLDQRPREVGREPQAALEVEGRRPLVRDALVTRVPRPIVVVVEEIRHPQAPRAAVVICDRELVQGTDAVRDVREGQVPARIALVCTAVELAMTAVEQPERVLIEAEPDVQAVLLDPLMGTASARALAPEAPPLLVEGDRLVVLLPVLPVGQLQGGGDAAGAPAEDRDPGPSRHQVGARQTS